MGDKMKVRVVAPTNIAVVKYWGKYELWESYHIPYKSSASFVVQDLTTTTQLSVEPGKGQLFFTLNGEVIPPESKQYRYVSTYVQKLRELTPVLQRYDLYVESENNFPTAAGFASSASGFAAMAKALQLVMKELDEEFYNAYMSDDISLSVFARLGSGSATRSIPEDGGFTVWWRGTLLPVPPERLNERSRKNVMFSSYAESLFPPQHWPALRIIYVKVDSAEKKVKSRAGMKKTVETNPLFKQWVEYEEREVLPAVIDSVERRDFERFAQLVMHCSHGLHAMMRYTYPSIEYLNDTSRKIMSSVEEINEKEVKAAYTFDAGPNAVVFTLQQHEAEVVSALREIVGKDNVFVTRMGKGARGE
jgi:diphosphomevalonate decarboxylase